MSPGARTWSRRDEILIRHVWRGAVRFAFPCIVVQDTLARTIVYQPVGAIGQRSHFDSALGTITPPTPQPWRTNDALVIMEANCGHATTLL